MATALERGLYDGFTADAGLSALVGNRVYPVRLPDENRTFPAIVYQVIDNPRQWTQDGSQLSTFARIQLFLYGDTYLSVTEVRDAINDFCAAHHTAADGQFGSPAVTLSGWFVDSEQDEDASEFKESGTQLFSKRLDIIVHTNDL